MFFLFCWVMWSRGHVYMLQYVCKKNYIVIYIYTCIVFHRYIYIYMYSKSICIYTVDVLHVFPNTLVSLHVCMVWVSADMAHVVGCGKAGITYLSIWVPPTIAGSWHKQWFDIYLGDALSHQTMYFLKLPVEEDGRNLLQYNCCLVFTLRVFSIVSSWDWKADGSSCAGNINTLL